ncbi:MAG: hypothetical protein LBH65_04425 [Desulfovibrio sp.]|jgi:hypothetical protein|nr:hypothetical protein [Desulfovibrio sp.]
MSEAKRRLYPEVSKAGNIGAGNTLWQRQEYACGRGADPELVTAPAVAPYTGQNQCENFIGFCPAQHPRATSLDKRHSLPDDEAEAFSPQAGNAVRRSSCNNATY